MTSFSRRLDWTQHPNALTRLLEGRRRAGGEILDLTESNPTRAGLAHDHRILDALRDPGALAYEPAPEGLLKTREAVGRLHRVAPDRVLLTASTSEAYSYLFKLFCDPGDEVLVPRPSYPLFEFLAALEGVTVRRYPLRYHEGWWLDIEALRAAVTPRTRAVVVVHPNNPTGSYLKRQELDSLVSLGLPIVSDEVFFDYSFASDPSRAPSLAEEARVPAFALGGLSKSLGLPQMKLGWIIHSGNPGIRRRLELVADTYLSVGAPVQHAAVRWLESRLPFQQELISRLRSNLEVIPEALRVEGGWYAVLRLPAMRSEEDWALHLLRDAGVLVQPGYFYDFETEPYIVVSLLTSPPIFAEGVRRIRAACG